MRGYFLLFILSVLFKFFYFFRSREIYVKFGSDIKKEILQTINKSNQEILIFISKINNGEIINKIFETKNRGIDIVILTLSRNKQILELNPKFISKKIDLPNYKFIIVDGTTLIIFSDDCTNKNFQSKNEYAIFIRNSNLVLKYKEMFLQFFEFFN